MEKTRGLLRRSSSTDIFIFSLGMLALIHNFCNALFTTTALDQRRHSNKIRRFYATLTTPPDKDNNSTYDFFNSIGKPRFISAPMVDQSSLSWRLLVKQNGADLAFSQMMHARNFQLDRKYRAECIDWDNYRHTSGSKDKENEAMMLDKPLIVQLCGNDPNLLVAAGKFVHKDVTAIDLNLGCPQKIAKKGNYGAYLLPKKDLIVSCLSAMVTQLDCPITAKIRKLPNDEDTINLALAIEKCGVKMLTVHGRTASDSKLFTGPADWDIIKKIKSELKIPVIANGGIGSRADALACLEYTNADGVMSSEALLENPKLFSAEGDFLFRNDYIRCQISTAKEYRELVLSFPPPRPLFQVVRSHLFKLLYRFIDAPSNADLRQVLATGDLEEMFAVVDEIERRLTNAGLLSGSSSSSSSSDSNDSNDASAVARGMLGPTNWYMRHRDDRAANRVLSRRRDVSGTAAAAAARAPTKTTSSTTTTNQ